MTSIVAAYTYTILMGCVIIFQICLAIGFPWGEASMGGKYPGKYPPRMRVVAFFNAIVLIIVTIIVLTKPGIILDTANSFANVAIWFVVAFSALSAVLNIITPSKIERRIWAPVSIVQLIACVIVALN